MCRSRSAACSPPDEAAAILVYTLAPDLLLGWPRANRPEQCAYLLPDICTRPRVGSLAGVDAISMDGVAALKPDLIVDVGVADAASVALAEKVERQTGIPCALLDGHLLGLSTSYEKLGRLVGREAAGLDFGDYCNMTLGAITNRLAFVPPEKRPRIYYARGRRGLTTSLGGAIDAEAIELVARNVAGEKQGGSTDVSIEQIEAMGARRDRRHRSRFCGQHARRSGLGLACRGARRPRLSRAGNSVRLDGSQPSGNRLIGLWWLAKTLYPDLFKDDLRELARDFYTKFYHVTPTEPRLDYVLEGKP